MKSFSVRAAMLAVAVLPAAAWPLRAEAVPLKDITQDKLRAWTQLALKASRDDPAKADFWKEVDSLIAVDPDQIVYEHDKGMPVKLLWECKPKKALDDDQRKRAHQMLRQFYDYATLEHDKGLINKAEAKKLDAVARVEIGPNPESPPPPKPTNVPLKEVTQDKLRAWTQIALKAHRAANPDFWKALDPLIVVDPDQIVYEHEKGAPVKLVLQCKPKRALSAAEREKAAKDLRAFYDYAILQHDKGLLTAADAKTLDAVAHLEIGPNPAAAADNSDEMERLKKELTDVRAEIDKLRKENGDFRAEAKKAADAADEIDRLKKMVADLRAQIDDLRTKKPGDSSGAIDQLRKDLTALRTEIDDLRKETDVEVIRKQITVLRAEIERIRETVVNVQTESGRRGPGAPPPPQEPGPGRGYIMVIQPSSMIYYDCASHCWLPGPAYVTYYPAGAAQPPRPPGMAPRPGPGLLPPTLNPQPLPPGAPLPPPERKLGEADDPSRVFWIGYRSYWQGDYDKALASFDAAVRIDDQDARYWYYKALAERVLGDLASAEASAKRGRELHAAHKPRADVVSAALERVQGQERRFLNTPEVVAAEAVDR